LNESRILLVEDNPDDILLTKRAFDRADISSEIIVTYDGLEALDYLHCSGEYNTRLDRTLPILVLLDLSMPRMGGHQLLKEMRADNELRFMPIVVLTSSGEDRDVCESYRLGANSYIQKPVDFERFVQTIRTLLQYWLGVNIGPKECCGHVC
jgi:two-component system response regulator